MSLILPLIVISGCGTTEVITKTERVEIQYVKQPRPKGLSMRDIKFYVVTRENLDEFLAEYAKESHGGMVFMAFSVEDYENLAVNVSELKRYIDQQGSLILYYESLLTPEDTK